MYRDLNSRPLALLIILLSSQLDLQISRRARRNELRRRDGYVQRRRLHAEPSPVVERDPRHIRGTQTEQVDRPGHEVRHLRLHRLQRKRQPLLYGQVSWILL